MARALPCCSAKKVLAVCVSIVPLGWLLLQQHARLAGPRGVPSMAPPISGALAGLRLPAAAGPPQGAGAAGRGPFDRALLHFDASVGVEVGADGNVTSWNGSAASPASVATLVGSGVVVQLGAVGPAPRRPAVAFGGSGRLVVPSVPLFRTGALSLWAVFRTSEPSRYQFLLNWGVGAGACKGRKNMELGFDEEHQGTLMVHRGCKQARRKLDTTPAEKWQAVRVDFPPSGPGGVSFAVDGVAAPAMGDWVEPGDYSTAAADLDIGARNDGGRGKVDAFFQGAIAELAVFPRPPSDAEAAALWRHACSAYGVACADHVTEAEEQREEEGGFGSHHSRRRRSKVVARVAAGGVRDAAPAAALASPGLPMRGAAPGSRLMPVLGFGTCCRAGAKGRPLVTSAVAYLRRGGRLLDTAFMYGNHRDVAAAISESGVPPGEVWITDKIQPNQMGYEKTKKAVDLSRQELKVPQIDLMLIHVPDGGRDMRVGSWVALVEAQAAGKVRHIGVSNFNRSQIQELVNATGVWPANNQIEFSPFSPPPVKELVAWMQGQGITVTAYGSLGHAGADLSQAAAQTGAEALQRRHGKTAAQVLLRWGVDRGVAVVPGATSEEHIAENLDILDFSLDAQDLISLESKSKPKKWRWFHGVPGK